DPCPVPLSLIVSVPSSRMPALSHFWIRRMMRLSPIRCSTKRHSRVARSRDQYGGGGGVVVARLWDLATSGISVSRGSSGDWSSGTNRRACSADHTQDPEQRGPRFACPCRGHRSDARRDRRAGHRRLPGRYSRAWLSAEADGGTMTSDLNLRLI